MTHWTLEPLQVAPVLLLAALYAKRVSTLRERGTAPPLWRVALFALGIVFLLAALVSPVDFYAERSFGLHMTQHILLGDLAPLALLAGLTGPLLRPVLALRPVHALRVLAHPLVALPLWIANMVLWHLPFAYEAAIRHDLVHALEHLSFFTAGIVMWMPVLETLPAPAWFGSAAKLGYIVVVRLVSTLIANVFLWSGEIFYAPYTDAGLSDQAAAGAILMVEGSLVTIAAFAWLFLRLFSEGERRQELLEQGTDPRTVERAVRFGRADDLS
jgi:putative membrane protein